MINGHVSHCLGPRRGPCKVRGRTSCLGFVLLGLRVFFWVLEEPAASSYEHEMTFCGDDGRAECRGLAPAVRTGGAAVVLSQVSLLLSLSLNMTCTWLVKAKYLGDSHSGQLMSLQMFLEMEPGRRMWMCSLFILQQRSPGSRVSTKQQRNFGRLRIEDPGSGACGLLYLDF